MVYRMVGTGVSVGTGVGEAGLAAVVTTGRGDVTLYEFAVRCEGTTIGEPQLLQLAFRPANSGGTENSRPQPAHLN